MYETNYPHSNMLNILKTLNVNFVDRSLPDFPMKKLMEGSASYLNKKEVRFLNIAMEGKEHQSKS
jgi:hypothetical protein